MNEATKAPTPDRSRERSRLGSAVQRRVTRRTSDRLIARLRDLGVALPADVRFERLYPGSEQRACGAWAWHIVDPYGAQVVGSPQTATETLADLLKAQPPLRIGFGGEI